MEKIKKYITIYNIYIYIVKSLNSPLSILLSAVAQKKKKFKHVIFKDPTNIYISFFIYFTCITMFFGLSHKICVTLAITE